MKLKNWSFGILFVVVITAVASQKLDIFQNETNEVLFEEASEAYAQEVYSNYKDAREDVQALLNATKEFVKAPSEKGLENLRSSWITARTSYSPTEAYRFYGGPIDDAEAGVEGFVNAWPLDEAYIDYVKEDEKTLWTGLINNPDVEITKTALMQQNEKDGEKNISTGFHAIEFLLWGQDFSTEGPGSRTAQDYLPGVKNYERRQEYLVTVTELLLDHLTYLENEWKPDSPENYRADFLEAPAKASLSKILYALITMTGDELSGERMFVAYDSRAQEDEHSCFSDTTHEDIIQNIRGVKATFETTFANLLRAADPTLLEAIQKSLEQTLELALKIPAPIDQVIILENNEDPARKAFFQTIQSLRSTSKLLENVYSALHLKPVEVSDS